MLKITRIELELISDIDMHLFNEKGMRGGISYIVKRHSKANDKYVKCYDSSEKVNTLLILMQMIYVIGQSVNIFHIVDLNGYIKKKSVFFV